MHPRTEEFLNLLLWGADKLARPTFTNLTGSYEEWAYGRGLSRQAALLAGRQLIEDSPTSANDRVYRLTAAGRLHALGGRDPEARWNRSWDGRWRMVLFDLPNSRNAERTRLRRHLARQGFGFLQNSVWITPDPLEAERQQLADGKVDVECLLLLEARPCAGESDAEIVAGAWDFDRINRQYVRHLNLLAEFPAAPLRSEAARRALRRWAAHEREAWLEAVGADPLLPRQLLPPDYLGGQSWSRRMETLQQAGRLMRQWPTNSDGHN